MAHLLLIKAVNQVKLGFTMRYLAYTLFILTCSITGCADDLDELSDHSSASKAAQTESKDVSQSSPKTLGELSYQELGEFDDFWWLILALTLKLPVSLLSIMDVIYIL